MEDEFITVLITLWSIWWVQRRAIHEEHFQSPHATVSFIHSYLSDLVMIPSKKICKQRG